MRTEMITVYYRKVFPFLEEDTFSSITMMEEKIRLLMEKTEERRREKILRMKNTGQKTRSLAAGILLHDALCETLDLEEDAPPFFFEYTERGKAYLPEEPHVHFNLSHSGEYVCCAVGDEPVGVDIQEKLKGKEKIAERFFTPGDRQMLRGLAEKEREDLFFRMWSVKESYVKLTGEGMARGLSGFEIDWRKNRIFEKNEEKAAAYFAERELAEKYRLCVCSFTERKVLWREWEKNIWL